MVTPLPTDGFACAVVTFFGARTCDSIVFAIILGAVFELAKLVVEGTTPPCGMTIFLSSLNGLRKILYGSKGSMSI